MKTVIGAILTLGPLLVLFTVFLSAHIGYKAGISIMILTVLLTVTIALGIYLMGGQR